MFFLKMFQDKSLECEMKENLCYNIPQQVNKLSTAEYTPVNDTLVIKTGVTTAVSKSTFLKVIAAATFLNFFLLLVAIVTFAALQAKTDKGPPVVSVTYTRWGNTTCRKGVTLVYAGRTGVTLSGHQGGAANYLCMPNDPEYSLPYKFGIRNSSYVYGTEYEEPLVRGRYQHDAPCAVCSVPTKSTVIMIPAKTACPSGWTREYYGYLMSENISHRRTKYECVDVSMESVPGSQNHIDGGHFYHVEAHCNGLACPPYNNYKELTCAVCSK